MQTDLEKAAVLYAIDAGGIGGDAGGDGGAAGAAGDGSALKRAVVTLTDAKGNQVSGLTDDNGKFLLKYKTATFTAPLVLRVVDAGGNILTSVTEETAATGKVVRANINPLTDKITSDVIPTAVAGTDKSFDGSKVDLTKLAKAKADLVTSVQAALGTAGVADTSKFDPVKSVYAYDGKGVDAVIESISHARDAGTGATQLRTKLVNLTTNADGTVTPTLITASTPLATTAVAVATNPSLTYNKITAWVDEINRCLALPSAAQKADADCVDADGSRLVSTAFKNSSKDWTETYRTLFSESDRTGVQGSALRNPSILFITRSTGSTVDDIAVVEFTFSQPRTGPLSGSVAEPIQYTASMVFRRDDALTKAKATNWVAYGNQRNFDWSVMPSYIKETQINPARQANSSGNAPSNLSSSLRMYFDLQRFDLATRGYVSVNVRAVRFKGPGLPVAGLVMTPSTLAGTTYLTVHNKVGQVNATTMTTSNSVNAFRLGAVAVDGAALYSGYWLPASVTQSDSPLSDFSALQAFSNYSAEIFLNSNPGNTTPDAIETGRNLAAVAHPATTANFQRNDLTPSLSLVTAPASGGCSFNIQWVNNPNAAAVNSAFIYGAQFDVTPQIRNIINPSVNGSTVNSRATSVIATAAGTTTAGCGANAIPALANRLDGNTFRQISIRATQARAQLYDYWSWNN